MSLFNSQTIFSILFTILVGFIIYYFTSYKHRMLEYTVREQAKLLQSVIMSMNTNNQNIMNMVQNMNEDQNELIHESVHRDMNRYKEVNINNELINVSDDSESDSGSESDDSSSESGSDSGSESDDSSSKSGSDSGSESESEVGENNTKKILFTGGNESHMVEHLDGPDIKVIELKNPLYPTSENKGTDEYDQEDEEEDMDEENDDDDHDDDDEDDEDSGSESLSEDNDEKHKERDEYKNVEVHEICEIKGNVNIIENETENNKIDLEVENIPEDKTLDVDNFSVNAVFNNKDTKEHETMVDFNSMNVQTLRQHLRNKVSAQGLHMNEASINKLTKKELIKNLA